MFHVCFTRSIHIHACDNSIRFVNLFSNETCSKVFSLILWRKQKQLRYVVKAHALLHNSGRPQIWQRNLVDPFLSFPDFCEYTIRSNCDMGDHWGLQLRDICNPCQLESFEIVRIENPIWRHYLLQKSGLLLPNLEKLDTLIGELDAHVTEGGKTDERVMEKYYSLIAPEKLERVANCFKTDYDAMKYPIYRN